MERDPSEPAVPGLGGARGEGASLAELRAQVEMLRAVVEGAADAFFMHDAEGRLLEVNRQACETLGYRRDELLALRVTDIDIDYGLEAAQRAWARVEPGQPFTLRGRHRRKDGTTFPVEVRLARVDRGGERRFTVMVRDMSGQVEREAALLATKRALRLLVGTNEALLRARDETELFQEVCRVAVEQGGLRMAWAGLPEPGPERAIRPVAWYGHEDGYLDGARLSWADEARGRGTAGVAMRTGRVAVANDIATDPRFDPWREAARSRGYASNAVLPLVHQGERLGVIGAFSGEAHAFGPDVIEVLQRVADDLAFGLVTQRARAASERAAAELALSVTERVREREQLRALTARVQRVREEEKARIARDLHDDLGQVLTALRLELRGAETLLEAFEPDERTGPIADRLVTASTLAADTIGAVQRLAWNLRSEALDRLGLDAALRQELRRFEKRTGLEVVETLRPVAPLAPPVATAAFRIAQEALTNVARHAGARRVEVSLHADGGQMRLEVADDGCGLPPGRPMPEGLGLLGMQERAREFGGEVTIVARAGGGTAVVARLPCNPGGTP